MKKRKKEPTTYLHHHEVWFAAFGRACFFIRRGGPSDPLLYRLECLVLLDERMVGGHIDVFLRTIERARWAIIELATTTVHMPRRLCFERSMTSGSGSRGLRVSFALKKRRHRPMASMT